MKKHRITIRQKVYLGILAVILLLNLAAWSSPAFCDWYISRIFPVWIHTYGRFTGLFPFSVGEIMLCAGVIVTAAALILGMVLLVCMLIPDSRMRQKKRLVTGAGKFYRVYAWMVLCTGLVMTLNCAILYHGSTFNEKYFGKTDRDYSLTELLAVRNFVVERCNTLSGQMERDENGDILYNGDMKEEAIRSMQTLGETYSGLSGFYPRPKALFFSDFMCQQHMQGYYFPFSMEANYNDVMYIMNKPSTFCHELAHLKGYIYEDEANFIGFLACISSEDIVFQYSGYLSVLYYLDNDFYDAIGGDLERYHAEMQILPQVIADNIFVKQTDWDRIEEKALIETEVVDAVSDSFTETTLKLNGVEDGMISYNRVVKLLLQYYEGRLF
ncbi:MAG: DUF3810 domain-containing protein [Lachnospiraceae bacterium]|nr:DUF3810 domain-containing protein [Lachnospiraceae bacterium]